MSRNGQSLPIHRAVPALGSLPRPLYARVESLQRSAATEWHSHPWAQLSYAIRGVLSVHTQRGRFLAPPQRAILVPPDLPHAVISSPATEMRSLYIDRSAIPWAASHCKVLEINPLTRELISQFGGLPAEYDEHSADGRLVAVLLDQLQAAAESGLYLPWPADPRLQPLCEALYETPDLPHRLADWASHLALSEKTLTRLAPAPATAQRPAPAATGRASNRCSTGLRLRLHLSVYCRLPQTPGRHAQRLW